MIDIDAVRAELAAGNKLNAVILVRTQSGMSLQEAVEYVDAMQSNPKMVSDRAPVGMPPGLEEIRRMALSGRKIEAIKRYREIKDCSLTEAKAAVEALIEGSIPPKWSALTDTRTDADVDWDEINRLIANGQRLMAIQVHRKQAGGTLENSKAVIDALAGDKATPAGLPRTRITISGGCLRSILLSLVPFIFILAACGQYVRTTEMHACAASTITANRDLQELLGNPLEVGGLLFVLGYSSESDFGGRTERSAGYLVRVNGLRDAAWLMVNFYESRTGYYQLEIERAFSSSDFYFATSGQIDSCARSQ